MFPRLTRIIVSLVAVIAAYSAYALAAHFVIEPPVVERRAPPVDTQPPGPPIESRNDKLINEFFPPGSWQRDNPKVLQSDAAMLLFKEYKNLPDGRVELNPCSMLFFRRQPSPEPNVAEAPPGARDQVYIMDVPAGAVLQFDSPVDVRQLKTGKIIGGQLVGPITIRSAPGRSTPENELLIATQDVQLTGNRVWTPNPVEFHYGSNQGTGRDMEIMLTGSDGSNKKNQTLAFSGIDSFELRRDVRMRMLVGGDPFGNMKPAPAPPPRAGQPAANLASAPPVEITCQGSFRFDVAKSVATFNDQVDVLRLNANGPSDQMNCEQLAVHFKAKAEQPDADDKDAPAKRKSPLNLEPDRIEAHGDPVIVRAPSAGGHARCQHLEYEISTGRITLEGSEPVLLRQGSNEIRTPRLDYKPAPARRQLGSLFAAGPGWLQGAIRDDPARKYQARWTKELRMRPQDRDQLVSLTGDAQVRFTEVGGLDAEEIHLWLLESDAPAREHPISNSITSSPAPTIRTVSLVENKGGNKGDGSHFSPPAGASASRTQIQPERLMATGNVRIDSPQLTGATGRLEVWFQQASSDAQINTQAPGTRDQGQRTTDNRQRSLQPQSHYDLGASVVRIQCTMHTERAELAAFDAEGTAHVAETQTAHPGDKPFRATGDRLMVAQADTPDTKVTVAGKPALVEGRGLALSGAKIQLERAANRMWIDGPGRMVLPDNRPLAAAAGAPPKQPQPLEVAWQGGMNFDGLRAVFERDVNVQGQDQALRTQKLEITLRERVDFANPPLPNAAPNRPANQPVAEQIVCRGDVTMENRSVDAAGQQVSIDQVRAADLAINQITGAVEARGPGEATSVRRGGANDVLAMPGAPSSAGTPPTPAAGAQQKLSYLNVKFENGVTGNLLKREMSFVGQVKAVYGPVNNWQDRLNGEDPDKLAPEAVVLTCDRLTVREMRTDPRAPRGFVELETQGNTKVESSTFTASSYRLTYSQQKDLLVLEGDGRTDAELFRQPRPGAPRAEAKARKIMFWRATNRVEVDDARYLDLGGPPGAMPAPQPAANTPPAKQVPGAAANPPSAPSQGTRKKK